MIRVLFTLSLSILLLSTRIESQTVGYRESFENFANPERGFYRPLPAASTGNFQPLSASNLASNRTSAYTPFSANYQITNTLVYRYYVLDGFKNSAISSDYLNRIRNDMRVVREAGIKIIPRFAYTISPNQSGCADASACPPYGDASKQTILGHIDQLKSIFLENRDVVAVVQMGFIGVWGEQYYTDFFGDASSNDSQRRLLDNNWRDRNDVLNALLNAVPKSRMVQVRYPQLKQRAIYGISAPIGAAPLGEAQAHNGSDIARIGFHNDCFLASPDDFGTYFDYGTSDSPARGAVEVLKDYFADDSRFVAVGGETCSDGFSPQNDCSGQALSDMRQLHYSYLNSEYNNDVNNDWQDGGCMAEIQRNLGYRFVMEQGTYAATATPGQAFDFSLRVRNVGFAAPYNARPLEVVLRNTSSGNTYRLPLGGRAADVRFWSPERTTTITTSVDLPANVTEGRYELLLNLPDTANNGAIADRPAYAMRMANADTWESSTGFNKLNHTLTVGGGGGGGGDDEPDVVSLYTDCGFSGPSAALPVGEYDMNELAARGVLNDKLSSVRVQSGYEVELYWDSEFRGRTLVLTADDTCLDNEGWKDRASSVRVRQSGGGGGGGGQTTVTVDGNDADWSSVRDLATAGGSVTSFKAAHDAQTLYLLIKGDVAGNKQFYLNVDDATSGYSDASKWNVMGADYLLENGILYAYIGDGTSFDWVPAARGTEQVESGNTLEVGIPRNSLQNLGPTLRIGFAKLDAEFTTVAQLPVAGDMARYTLADPASLGGNGLSGRNPARATPTLLVHPNPASSVTSVTYELPVGGSILLELYDLTGRVERTLLDAQREAGIHTIDLGTESLGAGVHLVRMQTNGRSYTRKLVVE